jgi:hypothetical protein
LRDYLIIGPAPLDETCVQIDDPDYYKKSIEEEKRFIKQLIRQFGSPPQEAELTIKPFVHEFGTYHEVVCWFDDQSKEAVAYCFDLEANTPETWENDEKM